ncbi:PEP-CTERM sorting domain-containing protein [Rubritalea sp.]|uniref:PEP-CTERM sorting domain-containing protein n=1 Tax=Rubritalea sp. TaxID=2109375 RepID=UPI003EF26AB6
MKNKLFLLAALAAIPTANAAITTLGSVTDNGGGSYTLLAGTSTDAEIEAFLNIATGTLDAANSVGNATDGSALKDEGISITAGEFFTFDWVWTNAETLGTTSYPDTLFVTIDLNGTETNVALANATDDATGTSGTFSFEATVSGTLDYGITVFNAGDAQVASSAVVNNISHVGPAAVPEPSSAVLGALGGLTLLARRRRK